MIHDPVSGRSKHAGVDQGAANGGTHLPDRGTAVQTAVTELWDDLHIVDSVSDLAVLKKKPGYSAAMRSRIKSRLAAAG